ncbi:centromere protein C isoform X2 [Pipra filicauda]|uniref:Centromere protein C n=1 Tax=Pipra filicauda TaxID=649802 RepID=A0A7R5KFV5_9PASS|nr:centromere protein C isoform X2 [Pipra filicauda]XP_039235833.1 centromere protein C isoform X2 [Pipra filicauda]
MAEALNRFKKDYRARFCRGGGSKIDIQPGQNVLKLIQDCFESCSSDLTINSPNATLCSTPVFKNRKRTSMQSQSPKAGSTNSVKRACYSPESSPTSLLKPVSSRGQSCESPLKPAIHDYVDVSKKPESPVSESKKITLEDVEVLCRSPAMILDPEDDHGSVGSPFPVEKGKRSPVVKLCLDDWNTPAAAKSCGEVENLEGPQSGRDEQVVLVQGTEPVATSSVQKEKTFSSALLAAVATGTLQQRYSASISPPSPPPVKDQDMEIENECEFLIDDSGGASFTSWISIPSKKRKSKKDGSATPVSKSQPSEQKKTQSKKGKNRKAQVEALTKQKLNNRDAGAFDIKRTSKSDPISNSEGNVLKSQSQKSTHTGKTKKDALRQDSPNQKKNTSWKPEAEELILSWSGLETETSDAEKCKTRVLPSEDLPMPSSGHQQEQTVSPKKSLKSSKNLQSASKASQHLDKRKQTAKKKLPKVKVAKKVALSPRKALKKSVKKSSNKKPRLQREKSSDSEPSEEEHEREPADLQDVRTTPLRQKLETPVIQKLAVSEKPRNVLHTLESPGGANNQSPVKALQHPMDSVKNSEKKQLPAKYSGKIPGKIPCRTNKAVSSNPEDTESQTDSDSSSVQNMARKKQKLSDVKIKNNKRKRNRQHGPQYSFVAEKAVNYESGPVLEHCDKFDSSTKSCEQYDTSSETFDDLNYKVRDPLSDNIARHKIVMPSNTPNVRRTKRIRLRPLEYWRGERINYTMNSSGGLVISGLVHPETQSRSKNRQRKDRHKQKANKTNRREIPASLDHNLADTSKPTIVLDPETNEEVVLECVNTESSHACSFKDEAVEIYKNLNTSVFATGKLILKPLKEKGHQFVHMDTIAFHIIRGKIIVTLHKTSYYLTAGDSFYVPPGNGYNIRNLLNEESILLFTQLKVR